MLKLTEYLVRVIENTYIVEMAYDRKKFKDLIQSLCRQIFENWCLIRFSKISGQKQEYVEHWKKELFSHLDNILKTKFKMNRRTAIREVIIKWEEMNNNEENHLIHLLAKKFYDENINIEDENVEKTIDDWLEYGLDEIIDILSINNYKVDLREYLDNL